MTFWRRKARETELDEEVRTHLNMATQALTERGVAQKEAERAAKREFGNVELTKEVTRDAWGGRWLAKLNQRRAVRLADVVEESRLHRDRRPHTGAGHWLQHRCFFVDRRLVAAEPRRSGSPGVGPNHLRSTWNRRATLQPDVRPPSRAAEGVHRHFCLRNGPMVLSKKGVARPITGAYATGSAFPTLKLKPRLGRLLTWQDDEPSALSNGVAAVISEDFWLEHFGGDPGVLGQPITVDGGTATIVGVMPRSFNGITVDYSPQVVLPFIFDVALHGKSSCRFRSDCTWFFTMARLKPGVTFAQAQANLAAIAGDVLKESLTEGYQRIDYLRNGTLSLIPGRTGNSPLGKVYGRELWTLQTLVGLLMIICCANLASLQLSRTLNRQHELVVPASCGEYAAFR